MGEGRQTSRWPGGSVASHRALPREETAIGPVDQIVASHPVPGGPALTVAGPDSGQPMVSMLPDGDGQPTPLGYPPVADAATLRRAYREMVSARRLDQEATALQRQGELGLWASATGQEAAQVGSGLALGPRDHVFPSYREHAVAMIRGIDPLHVLSLFRAVDFGGWDPAAHRFHLYTLVLAVQTLHATGYARGIQLDRRAGRPGSTGRGPAGGPTDEAAIVYFGDGAASEGDTSEALAWAAVDGVPLVFFCQNNQWAISTPVSRQTALPLHRRAEGFGVPGVLVDGNDVLAVHAVTTAALERARSGGGPTFIEAHTYRLDGHSTADDPGRYRSAAEVDRWRERDPIPRLRRYLQASGLADQRFLARTEGAADELAARVRRELPRLPAPPETAIRDRVYPTGQAGVF